MSQREDHIVLAKNMKAQQLDQILALIERGIQHDQPRCFVRKTKSQPQKKWKKCLSLASDSLVK